MADKVADALGVGRQSVLHHLRNLGVRKLITYHGRGRHAAGMTPLDAARLTIAVVGSPLVKDSVATVEEFGSLERDWGRRGAHLRFAAAPVSDSRGDETEPADEKERSAARLEDFLALRIDRLRYGYPPRADRYSFSVSERQSDRLAAAALELCGSPSPSIRARSRWSGGARRPAGANGPTSAAARCFPSFTPRTSFSSIPTCRCSRRNTSASALSNALPSPVGDAGTGVAAGEGPGPQRPRRKVRLRCHGRDDHARPVERFVASATRAFSD